MNKGNGDGNGKTFEGLVQTIDFFLKIKGFFHRIKNSFGPPFPFLNHHYITNYTL